MKYGDLRFYDKDLSLLAIFPRYISVNWQVNFCGFGTAEMHLEKTDALVKILTENKYLFITQGDFQALVTGYKIDTECVVFGKTPEWLLTKFLLCDFSSQSVSASAVSCDAVVSALDGKVPLTTEEAENDETDKTGFSKEGAVSAHELLTELLKPCNMGFSFRFNAKDKSFIFKVLKSQKNNGAIISEEFKTSYDESFTMDLQNEATGGVFYQEPINCGDWDPHDNIPTLYETPENFGKYYTTTTGAIRFEIVFFPGDKIICMDKSGKFSKVKEAKPFPVLIEPENKGIFSWSSLLLKTNETEAKEELSKHKREESTTFKTKNLIFGKDFFLGDIIKTSLSCEGFCVTDEKIVTGIHLWDEAGDSGSFPTLEKLNEKEEEENGI